MGKRHQKNPGKDFVKKKRKVGKGKGATDDATNTAFVSRRISIPTQSVLKNERVQTTKKKLSFTEFLSQLNHYNANYRHDSLQGLRELFTLHPVILTSNLSVILEKISPIFTDSNSVVRKALLLLLKHIIENVKKCNLVLFLPRLVTCMICAMTHLDNAIQLDSLSYMQLFLTDYSDLLIKNAPQLLNFYLSLLTLQSNVIDITKKDNTVFTNKVCSANKLIPTKTRLEIFTQLSELLKASVDLITINKTHASYLATLGIPSFDVVNRKEIKGQSTRHCLQLFDLSKAIPNIKLFRNWGVHPPANPFVKTCSVKKMDGTHFLFSCFAAKMLPILFECWMESGPVHSLDLDTKLAVAKLLLYLVRLALVYSGDNGVSQLRDLYSNQFQKCFLSYFPFNNLSKSENIFLLNMYLCEITITLYGGINKLSDNFSTLMLNFFSHTLPLEFHLFADNHSVTSDCVVCFTRCLRSIISCKNENTILAAMLKGGISYYSNCHIHSQVKKHLIKIFYEILLAKENMWKACESHPISSSLTLWLSSLPQVLKELGHSSMETSSLIFEVLGHAAAKNMLPMVDYLAEHLFSDSAFISTLQDELQRKAVTLVWYLPLFNSKTLDQVTRFILKDTLKLDITIYLMQIVNERLLMEYRSAENDSCASDTTDVSPLYIVSLYLSFYWNIVTFGNTTIDIDLDKTETNDLYKCVAKDKIPSCFEDKIQCICKCVMASDFSDQLWDLVSSKMKYLLSFRCIPLSTMVGVLCFAAGINKMLPLMESNCCFHPILTLVLRLLVYIYTEEMDDTSVPHKLVINLLLDVENLLPALLHIIISYISGRGLSPSILIKLFKERELAQIFYEHKGIPQSILSICHKLK